MKWTCNSWNVGEVSKYMEVIPNSAYFWWTFYSPDLSKFEDFQILALTFGEMASVTVTGYSQPLALERVPRMPFRHNLTLADISKLLPAFICIVIGIRVSTFYVILESPCHWICFYFWALRIVWVLCSCCRLNGKGTTIWLIKSYRYRNKGHLRRNY